MRDIDEGCDTAQVAQFCEIHKITYYALDYKYKLFETNNHMKYKNNLPKLVFMCSNNHLYAIDSNEQRETIFKKYANYTNGTRKIKQSEEEKTKIKATELFICYSFAGFYKLYDDVNAAQQPGKKKI